MSKRDKRKREGQRRMRRRNGLKSRNRFTDEDRRSHLRRNWSKIKKEVEAFKSETGNMPFSVLLDNQNIIICDSAEFVVRRVGQMNGLQRALVSMTLGSDDCFVLVALGGVMRTTFLAWTMRLIVEEAGGICVPTDMSAWT